MSEFVQRGAVPVDWLEIGGRRRHLHIILRRDIEGATATDTELDCRLDQRLHAWLDRAGGWWRGDRRNLFRETIALVDVEDREALEEWNRLRFLAGLGCALLLVIGNEAVSIDNGCAVLTLPDMAAHRQRLAEGEPTLSREECSTTAPQRIRTLSHYTAGSSRHSSAWRAALSPPPCPRAEPRARGRPPARR